MGGPGVMWVEQSVPCMCAVCASSPCVPELNALQCMLRAVLWPKEGYFGNVIKNGTTCVHGTPAAVGGSCPREPLLENVF